MSDRKFMQAPAFSNAMAESDQSKGIPNPPHCKPAKGEVIELRSINNVIKQPSYIDLLDIRRSERIYTGEAMTQEQLGFMLWSAYGAQKFRDSNNVAILRPVASAGCRHPFEIYALVKNVTGLKPGLYRYLNMNHVGEKRVSLEFIKVFDNYEERLTLMVNKQKWAADAPVTLFMSCIPYRTEWRYGQLAYRIALIDLGHIGQNIMFSAAALGLGSCCIAAYDQKLCDEALGLDGIDEYTVYGATVGAFTDKKVH
jgi:SagB-type dehydrogenase family enzyme